MARATESCACSSAIDSQGESLIDALGRLRVECRALSLVFLPDPDWPRFQEWHQQADKVAHHRSALLLALQRERLSQFTSPVHRFILDGSSLRPDVTAQYVSDLRDRWMLYSDAIERHMTAGNQRWNDFINAKEAEYPALSMGLTKAINRINEVWIVRPSDHDFMLEYVIPIPRS